MILVVDDVEEIRQLNAAVLESEGYEVLTAEHGCQALEIARSHTPDLIISDILMPEMDGFELCLNIKSSNELCHIPFIFYTATYLSQDARELARAVGAEKFLTKPANSKYLLETIKALLQTNHPDKQRQPLSKARLNSLESMHARVLTNKLYQKSVKTPKAEGALQTAELNRIIGESEAINVLLAEIEQVAQSDATVLIQGESGTGKELVADAIHRRSNRASQPIVKLNCGAIMPSLFEAELFGYEPGAFTGAKHRRIGRFEQANHGTLFLDEVTEIATDMQVKLLRVLQEGVLSRIGGERDIEVDVRIIAATNRDAEQCVAEQRLREDLFFRLNVFPIRVPSLRERREDIPLLVNHFVELFNRKNNKSINSISPAAWQLLNQNDWPGNVRQLRNTIERAVIVARSSRIDITDLNIQTINQPETTPAKTLAEMERQHIINVLDEVDWLISGTGGAAEILGMNPSTLRSRMQKHGIKRH